MKWLLCLLLSTVCLSADEPPPSQVFIHRITGLFSPAREEDLKAVLRKIPEVRLVALDFAHAEGTFAYDPAVAFKEAKSDKIREAFDQKLRTASNSTFGIQPLIETPREKLELIRIRAVGLDCKACCLGAYEAIYKIDGVAQATASFKDGEITALIDPAKTNRATLEEALKKRNVAVQPASER